jgi:hypothetical protein
MARRLALLLVAGVLLAGCGAPAPVKPTVPDARDARSGGPMDLLGAYEGAPCVGAFHGSPVPRSAVLPELPPGYDPAYDPAQTDVGLALVRFEVYTCETVTVGNVSEQGVAFAHASAWVNGGDGYRWEFFIDEPAPHAVTGLLESAGWPVLAASIARGPLGYEVAADGITYTLAIGQQAGHEQLSPNGAVDIHRVTEDGRHLQLSEALNQAAQAAYPTSVEAQGGVLGRIAGRVGGELAGLTQDVDSSLRVEVLPPEAGGSAPS